MKANKRFYGKSGRWYDYGDEVTKEDVEGLPKHFFVPLEKEVKPIDKVATKVSTKRGRKPKEDKNAKPKEEDK